MKKLTAGFTLIELLIVIALLGALAVGLLATIDPFEQLKKGRDTSARNTVSEFYNANLRYYSTKAQFPWPTSTSFTARSASSASMGSWITDIIDAGELKDRFIELAGIGNLAKIYVTSTSSENVAVCYRPESKSFQVEPNTVYNSAAVVQTSGCKSLGGTALCYYCIQ